MADLSNIPPLKVGTVVTVMRTHYNQHNGWCEPMSRMVREHHQAKITHRQAVDLRVTPDDGKYYYKLEGSSYWWSIASLGRMVGNSLVAYVDAQPGEAAAPVAPPPPPPEHQLNNSASQNYMKATTVSAAVSRRHGGGLFDLALLRGTVSCYAMHCCALSQIGGFNGGASDLKEYRQRLTMQMVGEWFAAVLNAGAYSGYIPGRVLFSITEDGHTYLTIQVLMELAGAELIWKGENQAHHPNHMIYTYQANLYETVVKAGFVEIDKGTIGSSSLKFKASNGAKAQQLLEAFKNAKAKLD